MTRPNPTTPNPTPTPTPNPTPNPTGLVPLSRNPLRHRDELAFLPAALEIVETPPSPIGRAIALTLGALFVAGVVWASLGQIDIVAAAPGKIVPSGRTKVIQPFEIGVVRAIHVQDGQPVKTGDVLVELDATISNAETEHLRSDLAAAQLDVARLRATVADGPDPVAAFAPPPAADPLLVATQQHLLTNQMAEQRAKIAAIDRQLAQKEAERQSYAATVAKLRATIPIVEERVNIRKYLADRQIGSKLTYLETLTDLVDRQKDLAIQQAHVEEAGAALAALTELRGQTAAEFRRARLGELVTAESKAAGLAQDLIRAQQRNRLESLLAPVDGTVQQLAIHTLGGVVTPAQALLQVVPDDSHLEIEAMVSNRDVGFLHAGQEAAVKVDTFNFTRYGLLHGKVLDVSADAITRDKGPGSGESQAAKADSDGEPGEQHLLYVAHLSLDRTQMDIDGRMVTLSPGMAVTAEIKTGSRRVISYLLSPLRRSQHDSLHER